MNSPFTGLELTMELEGKRPMAVMVDGSLRAIPQAGLQDASLVFVAPIEKKFTRYMAVFLDKAPHLAGPIRSARPYFIDWAVAYQPFFVHCAGCPEAIERLTYEKGLINLDYVYIFNESGNQVPITLLDFFTRRGDRISPYNLYIDIKRLRETVDLKLIKTIKPDIALLSDKDITDYSAYESIPHKTQKLISDDKAVSIEITRGSNDWVLYNYLPSANKYERVIYRQKTLKEPFYKLFLKKIFDRFKNIIKNFSNNFYGRLKKSAAGDIYKFSLNQEKYTQIDENYGRPIEIDNVVLIWVEIAPAVGDIKGRISIKTLDKGKAVFFMDGCRINGTWLKICNDMAIRFFNEKGERINFNPGNLWIEVVTDDDGVKIEGKANA